MIGNTIDIIERTGVDEKRELTKYYELVDKNGNPIDEEIYEAAGLDPINSIFFSTKEKAVAAR